MIVRFFRFLGLLWYADEHGWPEKEQRAASEPSGTSAIRQRGESDG